MLKRVVLFLCIFIGTIEYSYALPIGFLALGSDFFILFLGLLLSFFSALFFYFKNLKIKYKIIIVILVLIFFIASKYFYLEYKKDKLIHKYISEINDLGLYEFYYKKNFLKKDFKNSIEVKDFKENYLNYYIIDVREKNEQYKLYLRDNKYLLNFIRFPNLIINHKKILGEINKPIVVVCLDGNRSKVVSIFLKSLGYNAYYLKGGLRELGIKYKDGVHSIKSCKVKKGRKIFIGVDDKNKNTIDIPYMQLTYKYMNDLIKKLEKEDILKKGDNIILLYNKKHLFNSTVGVESFGLLLKELGYKNVCIQD